MKHSMVTVISLTAVLLMAGAVSASLVNNGNGLIYDTDLNVTWYDSSSPAGAWADAVQFASDLTVNGVGGWRLPSSKPGAYQMGYDGSTTAGYNITSSEMGHLFYTELGNSGEFDTSGTETPVLFDGSDNANAIHNSGPFTNLQFGNLWGTGTANYWSSTGASNTNGIWAFDTTYGFQDNVDKVNPGINGPGYAMAVHDGNVGVPEPCTLVLLVTAGLGLLAYARRRRQS